MGEKRGSVNVSLGEASLPGLGWLTLWSLLYLVLVVPPGNDLFGRLSPQLAYRLIKGKACLFPLVSAARSQPHEK